VTARRDPMRLALLAGWLLADLFLVLFLVGLSTMPAAAPLPSSPKPTPTPTTTPPTPTTPPKAPPVLRPDPVEFTVSADLAHLDGDQVRRDVEAVLAGTGPQPRVGVVLVFAAGPQNAIGVATGRANSVIDLLRAGSAPFQRATGKGYWKAGSRADSLDFVVFLYA
jgi:hypothetical protein